MHISTSLKPFVRVCSKDPTLLFVQHAVLLWANFLMILTLCRFIAQTNANTAKDNCLTFEYKHYALAAFTHD
jgi:hypothetical protein